MLKNITIKMDVIESMLYYWAATADKEKVGENYLVTLAEMEEMKHLYVDGFTPESARKVLSAISNREIFSSDVKKDRVFWNNNMWMMEDLEFTNMMVAPLKTLNLTDLIEQINTKRPDFKHEDLEFVVIPGHQDDYYVDQNKFILNFFRVMPDLYEDDKVTIKGKDLKEYILDTICEQM
jgi:hypothetical protein